MNQTSGSLYFYKINYTIRQGIVELRPVLVFIHGGDFKGGANFGYPGYFQASLGVVVVTINYRLNILGKTTYADFANMTLPFKAII